MNKITLKIAILIVVLMFSVLHLKAQVIGYQCSFEEEAERLLWYLNEGGQGELCANKWHIGKSDPESLCGGMRSLWVQ